MRRPVTMIGLDAADAVIVDRLVAAGDLPNLARLRATGMYGRLVSPAPRFAGGVWPTFYTGRRVASHGVYHSKLWRPDTMRVEVARDDWLSARPFWESLPDLRVCVVDVPMILGRPREVNGVYIGGWGTHDLISRGSAPAGVWRECRRAVGAPVMPPEHFGRQSERSIGALADALVATTDQLARLAADLLGRETFDFGCVVFGAAHRAGHYLWDRSQIEDGARPGTSREMDPGLIRVYQALDRAVGLLLDEVPDQSLVLVFAVHGMGPNPGWSDLLPEILTRLARHGTGHAPRRGALFRLKERIPFHWARPVLNRLPIALNQRLVSIWSRNMFDWSSTRYFPMPMDQAGYLRINLRGRERDGIVEPGAEYDAACDELSRLVLGLRDAESGEPIARTVVRAWAEAPENSPARSLLPDLVIPWTGPPAAATSRLVSDALPGFEYAVPPRLPSGRSGNHTGNAWFLARGPGVAVGEADSVYDVVDLVPTALGHLGIQQPPGLEGAAIDLMRLRSSATP
jgi:predicted AlkP superfamily phosphohydrolase/phosphomutase